MRSMLAIATLLAATLSGSAPVLAQTSAVEGKDFVVRRHDGATHNEASWRARLDDQHTFLFGRARPWAR